MVNCYWGMATILHYQEITKILIPGWMIVNKCLSFRKKKKDGERGRNFVILHLLLEFMLKIQVKLFLVMHSANFIFSSRFQWESSIDCSSWKKQWTWSCSIRQYTLSSHQLSPCQARKCGSGHMVFSQCAIRWALFRLIHTQHSMPMPFPCHAMPLRV